ncbi:hypothetical protein HDV00_012432 [Rhizophlyctis rosea]|nr:hypothetical protein HDV00_012432 [Rhizophlyctis rosea]
MMIGQSMLNTILLQAQESVGQIHDWCVNNGGSAEDHPDFDEFANRINASLPKHLADVVTFRNFQTGRDCSRKIRMLRRQLWKIERNLKGMDYEEHAKAMAASIKAYGEAIAGREDELTDVDIGPASGIYRTVQRTYPIYLEKRKSFDESGEVDMERDPLVVDQELLGAALFEIIEQQEEGRGRS